MGDAEKPKSYAACVRLGGAIYAAGALTPIALIGAAMLLNSKTPGATLNVLLKMAFVTVPALGVVGCAVTSEFFVAAISGPRRESVWAWWVPAIWLLSCVAFPPLLVFAPLFFAGIHRMRMLASKAAIWDVAYVYGALFVFLQLLTLNGRIDPMVSLWSTVLLTPFLSDIVMANVIVTYRSAGRLEAPTARRFQFSLRTLLMVVWMLGAYVTALILLLRQ